MKMHNISFTNAMLMSGLMVVGGLLASGETVHAGTTVLIGYPTSIASPIDQSHGDFVAISSGGIYSVADGGTPDIDLTWSAIDNVGGFPARWERHIITSLHDGANGGFQLNGNSGLAAGDTDPFVRNNVYQLTFTPNAGFAAIINSFNFLGDAQDEPYQYDWRVVDANTSAVLTSGQTVSWTTDLDGTTGAPFSGAPQVNVNFQGGVGSAIRLELARSIGSFGAAGASYVDNISFSQVPSVPEPSSLLLFCIGSLGALMFPRRVRRR